MNDNLTMQDVLIGLYVYDQYYRMAKVTRLTENTIVADLDGNEIRISRRSGKEFGRDRWWQITNDPEKILAKRAEIEESYKRQKEAEAAKLLERKQAVKEANPELRIEDVALNIKLCRWTDKFGRENVFLFTSEDIGSGMVRVECVQYGPANFGGGFQMRSSRIGNSVEEVLMDWIELEF